MTDKPNNHYYKDVTIADKAKEIIYGDRESCYGDPGKNLRLIAVMWSAYLGIDVTPEQVCDMMVQLKIARLKNTPDHEESKIDIIGYTLLKERINEGRIEEDKQIKIEAGRIPDEHINSIRVTNLDGSSVLISDEKIRDSTIKSTREVNDNNLD